MDLARPGDGSEALSLSLESLSSFSERALQRILGSPLLLVAGMACGRRQRRGEEPDFRGWVRGARVSPRAREPVPGTHRGSERGTQWQAGCWSEGLEEGRQREPQLLNSGYVSGLEDWGHCASTWGQ